MLPAHAPDVLTQSDPPMNRHRSSVDALCHSTTGCAGCGAVEVILTGMEADVLGANLAGADLRGVKNLTREQVDGATCDPDTKSRDDLTPLPPGKPGSAEHRHGP